MDALNDPKIIYICHPFGVDPEVNADQVRAECRRIASKQLLPLAPQLLLPQFIDEKTERGLAMLFCLRLVAVADEVWAYGDPTNGMRLEIAEAHRLGIPVVVGDCEALGGRGMKSLQPGR